jgi:hypothetical protein
MPQVRNHRSPKIARSTPGPRSRTDCETIRRFLRYLSDEAVRTSLPVTAYLIELAEASIPRGRGNGGARPRAKR